MSTTLPRSAGQAKQLRETVGLAAMLKGPDQLPTPPDGEAFRTRFAPSPTGYLHIGHAYAALFARETAHASGGKFLLRVEDIDGHRCRPEFEDAIYKDLNWMELYWDGTPWRQSDRMAIYEAALKELDALGVIYPCFCSRKQIRAQIEEAGQAPHGVHDEMIYPGICRNLDAKERESRMSRGQAYALRLDVAKAAAKVGQLFWQDFRGGLIEARPQILGDAVIARKDTPTSYHLAVTIDDYMQEINLVTRGEDLFEVTHVHRLLQALLGIKTPYYYHHNLLADKTGARLSKRNRAITLRNLRDNRKTPDQIWDMLGLQEHVAA